MKKILFLLLSVLLFSCSSKDDDPINKGFTLKANEFEINVDEVYQIRDIINEQNFDYLNCKSENETIVNGGGDGFLVGVNQGETYINITYKDVTKRVKAIVKPRTLERYYERISFGYKVKDTTDLKVMHFNSIPNSDDLIYLTGLRNKKLWIAKFNSQTKEQISEYLDIDDFELSRKINIGYGNYKDIVIDKPVVCSFFERDNGWVANIRLLDDDVSESINSYALIFKNKESSKKYIYYNSRRATIPEAIKWYKDSYLVYFDINDEFNSKDMWTCLDYNGEKRAAGKEAEWYIGTILPVYYDSYIQITVNEKKILNTTYLKLLEAQRPLFIFDYDSKPNILDKDFQYNVEIIDIDNTTFKYKINLTYVTGEKESHTYEFNTKELTIKEI